MKIEGIANWIKSLDGWEVTYQDKSGLYANNDLVRIVVIYDESVEDAPFVLSISTIAAFDRWANSSPIRNYYRTANDVIRYLDNNWYTDIIPTLLRYLSGEYHDLKEVLEDERSNK